MAEEALRGKARDQPQQALGVESARRYRVMTAPARMPTRIPSPTMAIWKRRERRLGMGLVLTSIGA